MLFLRVAVFCSVLQCVAVCRSLLQSVTVCCGALQRGEGHSYAWVMSHTNETYSTYERSEVMPQSYHTHTHVSESCHTNERVMSHI